MLVSQWIKLKLEAPHLVYTVKFYLKPMNSCFREMYCSTPGRVSSLVMEASLHSLQGYTPSVGKTF